MWVDGICKSCGCLVIEESSDRPDSDYKNSCSNPKCKNFGWHYNYDVDFQDYYEHKDSNDLVPL